ncbi:MAG: peptidoglycan DD-metalloendopeptidase family protein [Pseudolabrys sp.]|nr:peptidoglycan DD-metalloendopeptidase family protein [Pseudolabrys sp.]
MGVWSLGTGTYFAFKDDVLTRLIGRQAEMQFAYEDRVTELRGQIDRITSRQLLDQEQFEQKLEAVSRRQQELERRTAQISGEGGAAPRGKGKSAPSKPTPLSENGDSSREPKSWFAWIAPQGGLEGRLKKITGALDSVEQQQGNVLNALKEDAEAKAKRIQTVLAELGVDLGKSHDVTGSIGGPFVPAKTVASTFDKQLSLMRVARAQHDRFSTALAAVPVRKPVEGDIDMSSPFGQRMDPFLRGPAIHSGIDLRGDTGDPVRVTAHGTVTIASWQGGYGNMVEVDHHNGFSTRYGHLSKIEVKVGQKVKIGDVIGLIGSTGRSTGPHLHYETRVNDSAVDPAKFFKAGTKLGTMGDL